ncbi:hypothetical protein ACWGBV_14175, partial [Streptomyces sp. NPDC055051]
MGHLEYLAYLAYLERLERLAGLEHRAAVRAASSMTCPALARRADRTRPLVRDHARAVAEAAASVRPGTGPPLLAPAQR